MRVLTTSQSEILGLPTRAVYVRVMVDRSDDYSRDWIDLSDYKEKNWVSSVTYNTEIDTTTSDAEIKLIRQQYDETLVPLITGSVLNQKTSETLVVIDITKMITIETATIPIDAVPTHSDYVEVFRGFIDEIDWGEDLISIKARDLSSLLQDTWLIKDDTEALTTTGNSAGGTKAWDVVLQEMLDFPHCVERVVGSSHILYSPNGYGLVKPRVAAGQTTVNTGVSILDTAGAAAVCTFSSKTISAKAGVDTTFTKDLSMGHQIRLVDTGDASTFDTFITSISDDEEIIVEDTITTVTGDINLIKDERPGVIPKGIVSENEEALAWQFVSDMAEAIGWDLRYKWQESTTPSTGTVAVGSQTTLTAAAASADFDGRFNVGDGITITDGVISHYTYVTAISGNTEITMAHAAPSALWKAGLTMKHTSFKLVIDIADRDPGEDSDSNPVVDHTFTPSQYYTISDISVSLSRVRNDVIVAYTPSGDSEGVKYAMDIDDVTRDTDSISKYGRRRLVLGTDNFKLISTLAEAKRLAQLALRDLKDPEVIKSIDMPYFWPVEAGDFYRFTANNVHYSSDQNLGVYSASHKIEIGGQASTTLVVRGLPAGGLNSWLVRNGKHVAVNFDADDIDLRFTANGDWPSWWSSGQLETDSPNSYDPIPDWSGIEWHMAIKDSSGSAGYANATTFAAGINKINNGILDKTLFGNSRDNTTSTIATFLDISGNPGHTKQVDNLIIGETYFFKCFIFKEIHIHEEEYDPETRRWMRLDKDVHQRLGGSDVVTYTHTGGTAPANLFPDLEMAQATGPHNPFFSSWFNVGNPPQKWKMTAGTWGTDAKQKAPGIGDNYAASNKYSVEFVGDCTLKSDFFPIEGNKPYRASVTVQRQHADTFYTAQLITYKSDKTTAVTTYTLKYAGSDKLTSTGIFQDMTTFIYPKIQDYERYVQLQVIKSNSNAGENLYLDNFVVERIEPAFRAQITGGGSPQTQIVEGGTNVLSYHNLEQIHFEDTSTISTQFSAFDSADTYTTTAGGTKYTVPSDGVYEFTAAVQAVKSSGSNLTDANSSYIVLLRNGTGFSDNICYQYARFVEANRLVFHVNSGPMYLLAGDVITVAVLGDWDPSGSAVTVEEGPDETFFCGRKLY